MIGQRAYVPWILLLLAMLLPASVGAQSQGQGTWAVVTKRAACVAGGKVLLGEIAAPYGHVPPGVWERMAQTELWKTPSQGDRPTTYSARTLRELLYRHLGSGTHSVRVSGQLSLQRGGQVLEAEDIERRVVGFLTPRLTAGGGEVTLRNVTTPQYIFLSPEFHTLEITPQSNVDAGRITLRLSAKTIDGRILRRFAVSLFVDRWINVPCAAQPINPGDVLEPSMITYARKNAAYLGGEIWDGQGGPWMIKRPVGAGMPIYRENLYVRPLIPKGTRVELVFRSKHVQLSTEVESLEDGGQGDLILVRNLQSNREIRARVWDKRTVVIKR